MDSNNPVRPKLDTVHHIALTVTNIKDAVEWYTSQFECKVDYQDNTWAMIQFANIKIAFVLPEQHPPHLAFVKKDAEQLGKLTSHRDGSQSIYIQDTVGNQVEFIKF